MVLRIRGNLEEVPPGKESVVPLVYYGTDGVRRVVGDARVTGNRFTADIYQHYAPIFPSDQKSFFSFGLRVREITCELTPETPLNIKGLKRMLKEIDKEVDKRGEVQVYMTEQPD